MRLRRPLALSCLCSALTLAACGNQPQQQAFGASLVSSSTTQPPSCAAGGSGASLQLPPTQAAPTRHDKSEPLEFAQVYTVNRPLQEVGVWQERENGWSVLSLQIGSDNARSIAVRLRDARLPPSTHAWLCSADGSTRQGPFDEAPNGELWTPIVPGSRARLEIWVPTQTRSQFTAMLADVYGGYR